MNSTYKRNLHLSSFTEKDLYRLVCEWVYWPYSKEFEELGKNTGCGSIRDIKTPDINGSGISEGENSDMVTSIKLTYGEHEKEWESLIEESLKRFKEAQGRHAFLDLNQPNGLYLMLFGKEGDKDLECGLQCFKPTSMYLHCSNIPTKKWSDIRPALVNDADI